MMSICHFDSVPINASSKKECKNLTTSCDLPSYTSYQKAMQCNICRPSSPPYSICQAYTLFGILVTFCNEKNKYMSARYPPKFKQTKHTIEFSCMFVWITLFIISPTLVLFHTFLITPSSSQRVISNFETFF